MCGANDISSGAQSHKMAKRRCDDGSDDEEEVHFGRRAGTAMVSSWGEGCRVCTV